MNKKSQINIFVEGAISPVWIGENIAKHQGKTTIGAHSIFLGQVRADRIHEKEVAAIEYTSYTELAMNKMQVIREEMIKKYQLTCIHVFHSLGRITIGEICLFVFTSASHRKAAIESCEELVERVKKELPIWGKEIFTDETHQWKENRSYD